MALPQTGSQRRDPRAPGLVNAALVTALMILISLVALSITQPPPPTIPEFAPQAIEQIKQAPSEQSSKYGSAEGGIGLPGPGAGAGDFGGNPPIDLPRVRRCVGDPPRQIEDPQSPPCVPYWDVTQNNGGSTAKGVTTNEIRVAVPNETDPDRAGPLEVGALATTLQAFFNKRFEFYGRKLRLLPSPSRSRQDCNPPGMQADAVTVDKQVDAFASLGIGDAHGCQHHYYDALARLRILSVGIDAGAQGEDKYEYFAPYQWRVLPGVDRMQRHYAEWLCKSLVGEPPIFAGEDVRAQALATDNKREFALVVFEKNGSVPDMSILKEELNRCGSPIKGEYLAQQVPSTQLADMRQKGVTSVLLFLHNHTLVTGYQPAASGQGYHPEWITSGYLYQDAEAGAIGPKDQNSHVFGTTFWNKILTPPDMPWYWALKEVDPGQDPDRDYARVLYSELLLLASGVQVAGPKLNAFTFQNGLFSTRFPNPGAGGPPYYQGRVSFGPGDHTMIDDGTVIWWSQSDRSPTYPTRVGTYCYANRGVRYGLGGWPRAKPEFFNLFKPPCI